MKPLTYYIHTNQIEKLCERFGQELDQLDRDQKLQLRVLLSYYILGKDSMGDSYSLANAWDEVLQPIMCDDVAIMECLDILTDISVRDTESLLEALSAQLRSGNARLKTPVETTTNQLIELGVPESLAKPAAYITHKVDNQRPRTDDEQALISQVHKILVGGK